MNEPHQKAYSNVSNTTVDLVYLANAQWAVDGMFLKIYLICFLFFWSKKTFLDCGARCILFQICQSEWCARENANKFSILSHRRGVSWSETGQNPINHGCKTRGVPLWSCWVPSTFSVVWQTAPPSRSLGDPRRGDTALLGRAGSSSAAQRWSTTGKPAGGRRRSRGTPGRRRCVRDRSLSRQGATIKGLSPRLPTTTDRRRSRCCSRPARSERAAAGSHRRRGQKIQNKCYIKVKICTRRCSKGQTKHGGISDQVSCVRVSQEQQQQSRRHSQELPGRAPQSSAEHRPLPEKTQLVRRLSAQQGRKYKIQQI